MKHWFGPMANNRRRKQKNPSPGAMPVYNKVNFKFPDVKENEGIWDILPGDEEEQKQIDLAIERSLISACEESSFSPPPPSPDRKQKGVDTSFELKFSYDISNRRYCDRGSSSCTLYPCVICKDDKTTEELIHSKKCAHSFCSDCTPTYLVEQLALIEDIRKVKCPDSKCKVVFGPDTFRPFVPEGVINRWTAAIREFSNLLAIPRDVACPYRDCMEIFVDKGSVDDEMGRRTCPDCMRLCCVECKTKWHTGKSCEQFWEAEMKRLRENDWKKMQSKGKRNNRLKLNMGRHGIYNHNMGQYDGYEDMGRYDHCDYEAFSLKEKQF